MDWGIVPEQGEPGSGFEPQSHANLFWQPGGAALLADLIEAAAPDGWEIRSMERMPTPAPTDTNYLHSYALWRNQQVDGAKPVFRVEQFLGVKPWTVAEHAQDWMQVENDDAEAKLVVLVDSALGFRDLKDLWPEALKKTDARPSVILRLTYAEGEQLKGPLWEALQTSLDRLTVITSAADLRRAGVQISPQISWERSAQDTVRQLRHNPRVKALSQCANVVVSFGTAGALLMSPLDKRAHLLFDPHSLEGEWDAAHKGRILGSTSCLTAAVARQIMLDPEKPDLSAAIQRGVRSMRQLQEDGYGEAQDNVTPRFPKDELAETLMATDEASDCEPILSSIELNVAKLQEPDPKWWSILEEGYRTKLDDVAKKIVLDGVKPALGWEAKGTVGAPIATFGDMTTVDRREIEALHSIQSLITEYCKRQDKPFSIGVFGPPGAGKSFAAEQVAKSAVADVKIKKLEFNLSQFADPDELLDALHQVRDETLKDKMPLVVWDEFDTTLGDKPLGWLRYFLAPMQDGRFQQGQITHPIGPCIFVFTGSTGSSLEGFEHSLTDEKARAEAKVTDFLSRLHGYMDVLGPNPRGSERLPTDHDQYDEALKEAMADDPFFIVRRAIILRSILERGGYQICENHEIRIDDGVLRAFLHARTYRHGVRSMGSIIKNSRLAGLSRFQVSSLPQEDQLSLHVSSDFVELAQELG